MAEDHDMLVERLSQKYLVEIDIETVNAGLSLEDAALVYRGLVAEFRTRAEQLEEEAAALDAAEEDGDGEEDGGTA